MMIHRRKLEMDERVRGNAAVDAAFSTRLTCESPKVQRSILPEDSRIAYHA